MPDALAVGRHPSNPLFQPSSCSPSYEASSGGHDADFHTDVAHYFEDVYWTSGADRTFLHLCNAQYRFLEFFVIELMLKYRKKFPLARVPQTCYD